MKFNEGIYYVWIGGSCDYGRQERAGGAAYIIEKGGKVIDTFVTSELHTTEFRMMLKAMINAMESVPEGSEMVFLTNVAYLQNFDRIPSDGTANADLIAECIRVKGRLNSTTVKIVSYHKFPQLSETHQMAHEAMVSIR